MRLFYNAFFFIGFLCLCCCNAAADDKIYIVDNNKINYNSINIDLDNDIKVITETLGLGYITEDMPGAKGYYFKNSPLNFFVNEDKVLSILFRFYDEEVEFANSLKVDDLDFAINMSYDEIMNYLIDKGLEYSVKESSKIIRIKLIENRITTITYSKNDLTKIYKVQFKRIK